MCGHPGYSSSSTFIVTFTFLSRFGLESAPDSHSLVKPVTVPVTRVFSINLQFLWLSDNE